MKKFIKIAQYVLMLALVIFFVSLIFTKKEKVIENPVIDTGSVEFLFSGFVTTGEVEEIVPTTGSVSVEFEAQPTQLAGNYTDNGTMLRAWAEKNKKTIDVPAEAKNIRIAFTFAKLPKTDKIPGNLQLSLDGKNFCNGRLTNEGAIIDGNTYRYQFDHVTTQDKVKGTDLGSTVGKTLGIKVWIGENKNYVEKITLEYDL